MAANETGSFKSTTGDGKMTAMPVSMKSETKKKIETERERERERGDMDQYTAAGANDPFKRRVRTPGGGGRVIDESHRVEGRR